MVSISFSLSKYSKPRFLIIVMLFFVILTPCVAQNYMILQKGKNQKTRIKYEEGDPITYLQEGLDYYITDVIKEITKDYLILSENIVTPSQIVAIDIRDRDERNRTMANLTLLPAGGAVLLLLAESINSLYADGGLSYSNSSLVISGALLTTSLVLAPVRYKKFRHRGRNKIQIIPLKELEQENQE
ncbi:hypothetical protein [Negadavirga shengliensis]|uniref:Uncharacterized protein n=1 Tax=Negadavirga shengliensis TaxID=1389218 RepID=A0ABV9T4V0_9BACT